MFMKYFGVEASYVDFGKATNSGVDVTASGEVVNAIGVYPFNNQWSAFARAGLINATLKAGGTSSTDVKATYGVGGAFNFNRNLALRASYDIYSKLGDSGRTGETDVDMLSV